MSINLDLPLELEDGRPVDLVESEEWGSGFVVKFAGTIYKSTATPEEMEYCRYDEFTDFSEVDKWWYTADGVWDGDEWGCTLRVRNADVGPAVIEDWRL